MTLTSTFHKAVRYLNSNSQTYKDSSPLALFLCEPESGYLQTYLL